MQQVRLRDPIEAPWLFAALSAINVPPELALRDPMRAVRLGAAAPLEDAARFLGRVLRPEDLPGALGALWQMHDDEAALFIGLLLSQVLVSARRTLRANYAAVERT